MGRFRIILNALTGTVVTKSEYADIGIERTRTLSELKLQGQKLVKEHLQLASRTPLCIPELSLEAWAGRLVHVIFWSESHGWTFGSLNSLVLEAVSTLFLAWVRVGTAVCIVFAHLCAVNCQVCFILSHSLTSWSSGQATLSLPLCVSNPSRKHWNFVTPFQSQGS